MPNFSDIHPAIIHFPIALLFVAPLFLAIGIITKKQDFKTTFCILLLLGTASILLAVATGEAAGEKITVINDALLETLDNHESAGELSRTLFVILSLTVIGWNFLRNHIPSKLRPIAIFLFMSLYGFGLITLSTAAHFGGGLVHQHAVHSGLFNEAK